MVAFHVKGAAACALAGVIAGLASAAASGSVQIGWVIGAVLVAFVVMIGAGALRRRRITYTITSQRLTIEHGLISRELHETRLERVQNLRSRQSVLERILGVGTVDFDTAAGATFEFAFRGVADPRRIVRTVDHALRELSAGWPNGTGDAGARIS